MQLAERFLAAYAVCAESIVRTLWNFISHSHIEMAQIVALVTRPAD